MTVFMTRAAGVALSEPPGIDLLDGVSLTAVPLDALVRAVIARADPDADPLLDITVDGVRCSLTRAQPSRADLLSPREREIARMVARGYTNKMIASFLDISLWTVSTHLRRIFAKLGVSTRAAMVALVVERGTG